MSTRKNKQPPVRVLYGSAVSEAIASNDVAEMTEIRKQVFDYLGNVSEIERLLPELEKAIKSKGGGIRPLYAVTIQEAAASGDRAEIARIKAEVAYYERMSR